MKLTPLDNLPNFLVLKDGHVVPLVEEVDLHTLRFTCWNSTVLTNRVLMEDVADAVIFGDTMKPVKLWVSGKILEVVNDGTGMFDVKEISP